MGVMEVILLILGIIIFIGSFLIPARDRSSSENENIVNVSEETIRDMVDKEVEEAKNQISDIVDETITYAMEKTERSMDRLTNEKMLAVNEYSDTVLEEISKNHKEVVFMYDMLNDKHETLKTTVNEATKTASQVKQTVLDAEITAKETEAAINKVIQSELTDVSAKPTVTVDPPVQVEKTSDFKTINMLNIESIKPPAESTEKLPTPKKTPPKSKSAKTDVDYQNENESVPEIEITLNASGRTGGRNSNERILELHKAGKSNMAIAKELGLGIGEVKLVIDLFEGI